MDGNKHTEIKGGVMIELVSAKLCYISHYMSSCQGTTSYSLDFKTQTSIKISMTNML